jgi:phosphoglucosamine mutase
MSRKLFGTDGIRGVAGEPPLDRPTAYALGVALGNWVIAGGRYPEVMIGMDTRESGIWLAEHVAGGLASRGVATRFAGIITTPGVAYLARTGDFAAGVMISASHNPFLDNGLKVIDHSGFKLADSEELRLEEDIFACLASAGETAATRTLAVDEGLDQAYLNFLASTCHTRLDGLRIVLDCANGAAAKLAPSLFESLGATVVARLGVDPDGRNINLDCGSTHLDGLVAAVRETGADAGIGFDGDADRALFVSRSGKVIDGDAVMLITGVALRVKAVVATVMSNLGLEVALRKHGIGLVRTAVGDKYVLEEMVKQDLPLGGEQSGHVIFRQWATTGDGMLTALRVLEVMRDRGEDLEALAAEMKVYPQLLVNIRVKERKPLADLPLVNAAIADAEREFNGNGRVLVRFSGTEPLARVMVEGEEQEMVERWANQIAGVLKVELGG